MVLYPGHVVRSVQDRLGEPVTVFYVCIDFHLALYLSGLEEQPFHYSFVHIAAGQEDWLTTDLYVQTNVLHDWPQAAHGDCLGMLGDYSKERIVLQTQGDRALLSHEKEIINDRLMNEPDVSYGDEE